MRRHLLRKTIRPVLCLLTAASAGSLLTVASVMAGTAPVGFSPSSASIAVGANIDVDITVANITNLGGYDVFVQFDPAVVHMTSLADSGFVTGGGNIVVCNTATIDNVAGTGTVSCATISPFGTPTPGVSSVGATALLHSSFQAVGPGMASLTLTGTELQDPNGAPIAATLSSGSITATGAVGGIAENPEITGTTLETPGSSGANAGILAGVVATVTAAALALSGAAWYARRR